MKRSGQLVGDRNPIEVGGGAGAEGGRRCDDNEHKEHRWHRGVTVLHGNHQLGDSIAASLCGEDSVSSA